VIEQAFPIDRKVPNVQTLTAMKESRKMMAERDARFNSANELFTDLEKQFNKSSELPQSSD
jgi:DNA-damage-inducible protein J